MAPSGKLTFSFGKSSSLIGKSTMNGPCSIAMLNYQWVKHFKAKINHPMYDGLYIKFIPPIYGEFGNGVLLV